MAITGDMTLEEKEGVTELRKRMVNHMSKKMHDDVHLFYRFLKARNFDISQAENMLRNHLEWRKANEVDTILTDYKIPEVLLKYLPQSLLGYDKEGSSVRYVPIGNTDLKGLLLSVKSEDFEKTAVVHVLESTIALQKEQEKKLGKRAGGFVLIYNLENYSFVKATDKKSIKNYINITKLFQDNYPELLKAAYIINAPVYFPITFSILKKFLSISVLEKLHFLGTDCWKEELLNIIDADQLPAFLGGTLTDPDGNPLCKTFVDHGGVVPQSYYIHKSNRSLVQAEDAQKIVLSRASFFELTLQVSEPDSMIEWEFETKTRDIGFGLFYQEVVNGVEKNTELVPIQRIDTEEYSESGTYKCERAGTYIILFDNTYSWIRAKEIYCRTSVVTPKEHEAEMSKKEENGTEINV